MRALRRTAAQMVWHGGRQAAVLFVLAGFLTLFNNLNPADELDRMPLTVIGVLAVLLGVVEWLLPWERWPARLTLINVPIALSLVAVGSALGGNSAYSHSVFFVVVFVWVGLSQPVGTSWWLVPLTSAAYVWPLLVKVDPGRNAVSSVTVAVPICVLVGETIARSVRRQAQAVSDAAVRADVAARLVDVVADVSRTLDADQVLPNICDGVRRLLHCRAAAFVSAADGVAEIVATAGPLKSLRGLRFPAQEALVTEVLRRGAPVAVDAAELRRYPDLFRELPPLIPDVTQLVAVPCAYGSGAIGALFAVVGAERGPLREGEVHALQVLASHVGSAQRTAQTHAEVQLARAHEVAVVEGMPDGAAVVDARGMVRTWNAAAARLTGIAAADALGRPLALSLRPDVTIEQRSPTGAWLEVLGSPLPGGELVVSIRDVSRAKALDEAKDLFLATTSHELRSPLTVVKGFATTLAQRWDVLPDDVRRQSLDTVVARTEGLIRLVDALLLSVRAGTVEHQVAAAAVDVRQVLFRSAAAVAARSPHHRGTVSTPDDLPLAWADEAALEHVVDQLVENAVKYAPDSPLVELSAALVPATATRGAHLRLRVADRGPGLPDGSSDHLFERFVQGEGGDRRRHGGVGLGLHIARTLVASMGGQVGAANREGGGAVFTVDLPVAAPQPRWPASSWPPVPAPRGIVIADGVSSP